MRSMPWIRNCAIQRWEELQNSTVGSSCSIPGPQTTSLWKSQPQRLSSYRWRTRVYWTSSATVCRQAKFTFWNLEVRYFIYNSKNEIDRSYLFLTDHSLNFFSKETAEESQELLKIFQFIAEKASNGRINPESLEQFLTDPRTLRRRIKLHNQRMQNFLIRYLPIIAENGELSEVRDGIPWTLQAIVMRRDDSK